MKLWIDGQCLQTASRNRGIGRYVLELIRAISKSKRDIDLHVSLNAVMSNEALSARSVLESLIPRANIRVWQGACREGETVTGLDKARQLSEFALIHHVNCLAPDVALSASPFEGQSDPASPLMSGPQLTCASAAIFYDAIPMRYPDEYLDNERKRSYFERRLSSYSAYDGVLCISEFSRREIETLVGHPRCTTIDAGVSPDFLNRLANQNSDVNISVDGPYVLYVGALDWRKNVELLPQAFSRLPTNTRLSHTLVLAGDHEPHLLDALMRNWTQCGLSADRLVSVGIVSDEQLIAYNKSAKAVVQPSFMEGFGLTALEAITSDVPVLAAKTGAMPEVVGTDDALFDPNSPDELAEKLDAILSSEKKAKLLLRKAKKNARKFTWERTGELVLAELDTLIGAEKRAPSAGVSALRKAMASSLPRNIAQYPGAAEVFAIAEPRRADQPSLIIDATYTIRSDLNTGIQRVVRKICAESLRQAPSAFQRIVAYCDGPDGWFDTGASMSLPIDRSTNNRLSIHENDHILALDSSWELHREHEAMILEARLRGAQITSCLYDTVPLKTPAFCGRGMPDVFTQWFRFALTYSTGFICISKAIADELIGLLEAMQFPRKVKVGYWPLGADFTARSDSEPGQRVGKDQVTSLLMVGTIEPRKGYRVAIEAFEQVWASGVDARLTIVGKQGWGAGSFAQMLRDHPENGSRLIWHENLDDAGLAEVYSASDALVSASYAEGFGLPVVEAGFFGKPVIVSDIPVFREVAKGAVDALFFPVGEAAGLASAVTEFVRDRASGSRLADTRTATWPDWTQSTRCLLETLASDVWYHAYEPRSVGPFPSPIDIGRGARPLAVPVDETDCKLRVVQPLIVADEPDSVEAIIAVTNRSNMVWPGKGAYPEQPVCLSYHVLNRNGGMMSWDNERTPVPLILAPGDTYYMSVRVPSHWIDAGAAFVDVEMVQDGVGWWGNPLRIAV